MCLGRPPRTAALMRSLCCTRKHRLTCDPERGSPPCPRRSRPPPTGGGLALADLGHTVAYTGQSGPAMSVVMPCAVLPDAQTLTTALAQTWTWPGAADAVADLHSAVYIGELMGRFMPHQQRLEISAAADLGDRRTTRPAAVLWHPAGYLAEPAPGGRPGPGRAVQRPAVPDRGHDAGGRAHGHHGARPARPARPAVQGQEPGAGTARGAAEEPGPLPAGPAGDVILDGHTVEGTEPGSAWRASRVCAIAEPPRQVLDLDPGPQHAVCRLSPAPGPPRARGGRTGASDGGSGVLPRIRSAAFSAIIITGA